MWSLIRRWLAQRPVRCLECGGRGTSYGYSPASPLNTFRRPTLLTCRHCAGTGRMTPGQVTAYEKERDFWRLGLYKLDPVWGQVPDGLREEMRVVLAANRWLPR